MTSNDAAYAMLDILDRERKMILDGDISELERFAKEKETIARHLPGLRDPRLISRLSHAARRNANLIEAAAKGVRAAIDRVKDIRAQAGRLNTYTKDGMRASHATSAGSLERRA